MRSEDEMFFQKVLKKYAKDQAADNNNNLAFTSKGESNDFIDTSRLSNTRSFQL